METLKKSLLLSTALLCIIYKVEAMEASFLKEDLEQTHPTTQKAPLKLSEQDPHPTGDEIQVSQQYESPNLLSSNSAEAHRLEQPGQKISIVDQSIRDPNSSSALLPVKRALSASLEEEAELNPIKRRLHWESQYAPSHAIYSSNPALSKGVKLQGLQSLLREQLPLADPHSVYFFNREGTYSNLMQHCQSKPTLGVCLYGPDENGKVNYVTEDLSYGKSSKKVRHKSVFAWTKKEGYNGDRDKYPIYPYTPVKGFPMDRGHGIDFIITIDQEHHSHRDHKNYTPQNSIYNQKVRNHLVGKIRKDGGNFIEIPIYAFSPETVEHKIFAKSSSAGKVEKYQIDVPIGFLFIEMHEGRDRKLFYFPNFIDYEAIKGATGVTSYLELSNLFELEEASLYGSKFGVMGANVYNPDLSIDTIERRIRENSFIGYRALSGRYQFQYKHNQAVGKLIPKEAHQALVCEIALRQLDQMAENEFTSVEYKLSHVATFLNDFPLTEIGQSLYDPPRAIEWFKRAKAQVEYESTVEEKLDLLTLFENREELKGFLNREELLKEIKQQALRGSTIREKWWLIRFLEDPEEKREWLQRIEEQIEDNLAKDRDEEDALCEKRNLADCYAFGELGVKVDSVKAVALYREIIERDPSFREEIEYLNNFPFFKEMVFKEKIL